MREITVATVQMRPELGNAENNLVRMSDFVSKIASQQKVDLIVFPELITCGYELGVRFTELAQRVPGPAINLMAQRAADAGVFIAFGLATKERVESILYNSAVMVGPDGELLGVYNKVHLRGEERMAFREGYRVPIIETHEIGRVGLMLGWDLAFPEVARCMTLEGAELLCVLGNWETAYMDEWKTYVRARAYENALFVAAANRVGEDVTMSFGGESMIVGPRGKVYASLESEMPAPKKEAGTDSKSAPGGDETPKAEAAESKSAAAGESKKESGAAGAKSPAKAEVKAEAPKPVAVEGYCTARIDLDDVRRYREEFQTLQLRQPTVYRPIVKRY
jgi:predicted amidohydrolase